MWGLAAHPPPTGGGGRVFLFLGGGWRSQLEGCRSPSPPARGGGEGGSGPYIEHPLYWHNSDMRDELMSWGGKVVRPMPRSTGKTGKGSGKNLKADDHRNRRYQGDPLQEGEEQQ